MRGLRSASVVGLLWIASCGGKEADATSDAATNDASSETGVTAETGVPSSDTGTSANDTGVIDSGGVVDAPIVTATKDLDLLLVVDNSSSMADKQRQLARAVPVLIASVSTVARSIRVGVVTSSLGSVGTSACGREQLGFHGDDQAHLLPRSGEPLPATGFDIPPGATSDASANCPTAVAASAITWAFDAASGPATYEGAAQLPSAELAASCVIESAQQDGCGYEQTWEAAYRFLADPAPYAKVATNCTFNPGGDSCTGSIVVSGVDDALLAERKSFLRDDAALAVVVLSDENDFSIKPTGFDWLPWALGTGRMGRGWSACEKVPDDFEPGVGSSDFAKLEADPSAGGYGCWSCLQAGKGSDPNCSVPWSTKPLDGDPDGRNERGFHQVQRYGYNFLWERDRYVKAFTGGAVCDATGQNCTANPFAKKNVVVGAIVGVPKELLVDASGSFGDLDDAAWAKLISPNLLARDPHMIESIAPRTGVPKFAGDRKIDPINGGDRDVADGDDLQYACIAARTGDPTVDASDCGDAGAETTNPICAGTGNQPYFKAYPGLRHLRIVHDVDATTHLGFVGSICDTNYDTTIAALAAKIRLALGD